MLEIILIYTLCKSLGNKVRLKGRNARPFQLLLVLAWLGGEVFGAVVGVVMSGGEGGAPVYIFALIGAAVGAVTVFLIVRFLPAVETQLSNSETAEVFE